MIRILFRQLLDEKSFRERRHIPLTEVCDHTGISRPTLSRIANIPGYGTNTDTIDVLCRYFECQPGALLEWIDEEQEETSDSPR